MAVKDEKIKKLYSNLKTSYDTYIGLYKGKRVFVKVIKDKKTYDKEIKVAKRLKNEPGANQLVTTIKAERVIVYTELKSKTWFQLYDAIKNKKTYENLVKPVKYKIFDNIRRIMKRFHNIHNIAHHDLKTKNIMFTKSGRVKIIDYDTCKIFKPNTYDSLDDMVQDWRSLVSIFGNIHFRESLLNSNITPWSRIYSQGKLDKDRDLLMAFMKISTEFLDASRYFV